jgi:hypothetical protein
LGGGANVQAARVQRDFPVAAFTALKTSGPQNVIVRLGDGASVRAVGDQEAVDRLKIEVVAGELRIGQIPGNYSCMGSCPKAMIYVTNPALTGAATTGPGNISIGGAKGDSFAGAINGPGNIQISGSVVRAAFIISGPGSVDANGLTSRRMTIAVNGPGLIYARASESADIAVAGPGSAYVKGTTNCRIVRSGPGRASCGK